MDTVSGIAALVLGVAFAWAAAAKAVRYPQWREALARYEVPAAALRVATPGVPAVELAVALLLLSGSFVPGAALSVALLAAFSMVLVRARALHGDRLPCGCFGRTTERDVRAMLLRNGSLGFCAALILIAAR